MRGSEGLRGRRREPPPSIADTGCALFVIVLGILVAGMFVLEECDSTERNSGGSIGSTSSDPAGCS